LNYVRPKQAWNSGGKGKSALCIVRRAVVVGKQRNGPRAAAPTQGIGRKQRERADRESALSAYDENREDRFPPRGWETTSREEQRKPKLHRLFAAGTTYRRALIDCWVEAVASRRPPAYTLPRCTLDCIERRKWDRLTARSGALDSVELGPPLIIAFKAEIFLCLSAVAVIFVQFNVSKHYACGSRRYSTGSSRIEEACLRTCAFACALPCPSDARAPGHYCDGCVDVPT
jgi:hypothetical protein